MLLINNVWRYKWTLAWGKCHMTDKTNWLLLSGGDKKGNVVVKVVKLLFEEFNYLGCNLSKLRHSVPVCINFGTDLIIWTCNFGERSWLPTEKFNNMLTMIWDNSKCNLNWLFNFNSIPKLELELKDFWLMELEFDLILWIDQNWSI